MVGSVNAKKTRPPRPAPQKRAERDPLSRERILQAGLALADREGLDAVSMRRVGAELGVEAMSLYRHVANKEELLSGLRELMLTEVRHHDGPSGDWKERLRVVMRSYRAACLAHPAVAKISSGNATEVSFIHFEQDLATMEEAGFGGEEAAHVLRSLLAFTAGMISAEINAREARLAGKTRPGITPEVAARYPHLVAAYDDFMSEDRTEAFEYGLERLLAGIELERERLGPSK